MSLHHLLRLTVLCYLLCAGNRLYAQVPPRASAPGGIGSPPVQRLAGLQAKHKAHILSDTAYLRGVDSIAPLLLDDDSLKERLYTYQQVAFNDLVPARFRMHYYWFLALQAVNKNRYGSAIYYSEKNNEEGVRAGIFEKDTLQHSDLFAISVYGTDKDYDRLFAKYRSLRPSILGLVNALPSGKVSAEEAFIAISILNEVASAAADKDDTAKLRDVGSIAGAIAGETGRLPDKYSSYLDFYTCIDHMIRFDSESEAGHRDSAQALLEKAIGEVLSPRFLPNIQPYTTFDLYNDAFDFYLKGGQTDSAQHYLDLVRKLSLGLMEHSNIKLSFLLDGSSKVEAARGAFEAAYRDLRKAYQIADSSYTGLSSDKDNNLYALAEAENTRLELMRAERKKAEMQRFNIMLFFLLALLLLMALSAYFIFRFRSKQRMLQLRLGLARNFHDEIGPMLLFANTLLKKEAQTHPSPALDELKSHLAIVMEAVRGISHDLKANEIASVSSFGKEVTTLLEKVRSATGIDFTIRLDSDSRVISHFQCTHLRKIINELIGNSIKHAGCHSIHVSLLVVSRRLDIGYSDDGPGMAAEGLPEGIGLQNIQERAALLNGTFKLNNAYPKGYSIDIQIPLL